MKVNCGDITECWLWAFMVGLNPGRLDHMIAVRRLVGLTAEAPADRLLPFIDGLVDPDPAKPKTGYVRKGRRGLVVEFSDEE